MSNAQKTWFMYHEAKWNPTCTKKDCKAQSKVVIPCKVGAAFKASRRGIDQIYPQKNEANPTGHCPPNEALLVRHWSESRLEVS